MTVDRAVCQRYDEPTVALVTVYAQLVAMAMALALRNAELEVLVDEAVDAVLAATVLPTPDEPPIDPTS